MKFLLFLCFLHFLSPSCVADQPEWNLRENLIHRSNYLVRALSEVILLHEIEVEHLLEALEDVNSLLIELKTIKADDESRLLAMERRLVQIVTSVERDVPVEKLKSRGFMQSVGNTGMAVASAFIETAKATGKIGQIMWRNRKDILAAWPALMETMREDGLEGVIELIQPGVQGIVAEINAKTSIEKISQKIENLVSALTILSTIKQSNTALNALRMALDGLGSAGEWLTGTPRNVTAAIGQDLMASRILTVLLDAKIDPTNYSNSFFEQICPTFASLKVSS